MTRSNFLFPLVAMFLFGVSAQAQTGFYSDTDIQQLELYFSQTDWDYQLDTSKAGAGGYVIADSILINGVRFDSVGVKYKGNSSYDETFIKNPFHIELNTIFDQSYDGYTDIKLSNGYGDPSLVREVTSFKILENYMDAPQSNFAKLYINGVYIGLYSNTENIDKEFCSAHFYSSNNPFFKCNPTVIPSPTTKSNLRYLSTDSAAYANYYEQKSNNGWSELINTANVITNDAANIETVLDLDRAIWMLAFNNVLVNLDSYSGVFAQNYYVYQDDNGRFNPIIWDLNMSLGGFPYVGSGNSSMGSLSITNMQQLPLTIHSSDTYWPLVKAVMNNAMYKRMYVAHVRTIVDEFISSGTYLSLCTDYQTLIDNAVAQDTNAFFAYSEFQGSLTTDLPFGSYSVPGISNLMSARLTYLNSTSEFQLVAPIITAVTPSNSAPTVNTAFSITASVTNASGSGVYLGYRGSHSDKFTRIVMLDDGLHDDGTAGDNVYGASVTMSTPFLQYYVYAENSSAGVFSPKRAEHEYYTIGSDIPVPDPGIVAINEFLAINDFGQQNEYTESTDWIELYNTSSTSVSLYGLFLSDDTDNLMKYAFPSGTSIPANGFLAVWADEDASGTYLHANFKLAGSGEKVILSDYTGNILDSITFGQQTADVSVGRCPDGTGSFDTISSPSFLASNCLTGISENALSDFLVYPNPGLTQLQISQLNNSSAQPLEIVNVLGTVVYKTTIFNPSTTINVADFDSGIYWIKIGNYMPKKWLKL